MKIDYQKLFEFSRSSPLKSRFTAIHEISKAANITYDQIALEQFDPLETFTQLSDGIVPDLKILQNFALMAWEDNQWTLPQGRVAMKNWWLSALHQDQNGQHALRLIMVLRSVLADTERYPAPKHVVKLMRQVFLELVDTPDWSNTRNTPVLKALVAADARKLAMIAFARQQDCFALISQIGMPRNLPIIHEAQLQWLDLWIRAPREQRYRLRQNLTQVLNPQLTILQQQSFFSNILNHPIFPQDIGILENRVKDFPELVNWLSSCARQPSLKLALNLEERKRLACWIGTGNYEALKQILINLTQNQNPEDAKKTINRYIFWRNYQNFIQESWLLLPQALYLRHPTHLGNIKPIEGCEFPIVVLKIGTGFIFQSFLGDASENDLIMTNAIQAVENILSQNRIRNAQIEQLPLVLIHDHTFLWQTDLAYTLDQHFHIQAKDQRVFYADHKNAYSEYLQEIEKSDFKHERKQWKNLPKWIDQHLKNKKYPEAVFKSAALTVQRYQL